MSTELTENENMESGSLRNETLENENLEVDQVGTDKKRLITFIAVAYGVTALMSIIMYIGYRKELDLTNCVSAQMMYPAAGVALGYLLFCRKDKLVPKPFMIVIVASTIVMMLIAILSVIAPITPIVLAAGTPAETSVDIYYLFINYVIMAASIALWVTYFVAGKARREHVGLRRQNWKWSIILVIIFLGLYIARITASIFIDVLVNGSSLTENFQALLDVYKDPQMILAIVALPFNYFFILIAFFGEEYGWRYYLQGVLQKKFGMKLGILLLGVVWGLWHMPVDFMFYTQDTALQMQIAQIITCVALAIFFGFAYLKTQNIWVPVCMHYLNNNLIPIISGNLSTDVLQNQHVEWTDLLWMLVIDAVVFGLFIFTKEYKEKKEA